MLVNNFTKLLGALLVVQGMTRPPLPQEHDLADVTVSSGLPTSFNPRSLVKRDASTRAWFAIFGDSQKPELQDLADGEPSRQFC